MFKKNFEKYLIKIFFFFFYACKFLMSINIYIYYVLFFKNRKSSIFFLIFCVPEVTKLTLTLFIKGIDLFDFFFFCISAIVDELNQWVGSKGQLMNKKS